jgi:glycosyltransferase involved in cell wall biosynthesis
MEYSGLKLFDYKSAGLAIIASGQNEQPTAISHGKTGIIVPPCDGNALRDAICRLASDPELRQNLGRAARIEAENLHGWDHTTALLDQTLNHVVGA